jgi:hypothetical protein
MSTEKAKPAKFSFKDFLVVAGVGWLCWVSVMGQPSAKEQAERDLRGFRCLSAWDGSSADMIGSVKAKLRDPSSFEHITTLVTPANAKGQHRIVMEYRARNGFAA